MLENLQPRKYDKNYVERFVTLLHESKTLEPKYSVQRKKLKLNSIKSNKKNSRGIYITLPKLDNNNHYQGANTLDNNNDKNTISFPQHLLEEEDNNIYDNNNNYNTILTDTVKDILYKNDDIISNLDSYKEREKLLYEILKTKRKFHTNKRNNLYSSTEINQLIYNNINMRRKNFLSPKFIRNFDKNLAKSIEKRDAKKLTENQIEKLYYISELKLFDSIDEINRKNKILKEVKDDQKRRFLNRIDLFKYDKEKWERKRKELNKNINEIMFNKFNSDNKRYLLHMRKGVDKVHENVNFIEKDLGKLFNDINDFIDKNSEYLKENSQKTSQIHSKRGSMSIKQTTSITVK